MIRSEYSLEPLDFIARLAALVPPPRAHLTRFHGVFAAHAALRAAITPGGRGAGARKRAATRPATDGSRGGRGRSKFLSANGCDAEIQRDGDESCHDGVVHAQQIERRDHAAQCTADGIRGIAPAEARGTVRMEPRCDYGQCGAHEHRRRQQREPRDGESESQRQDASARKRCVGAVEKQRRRPCD